MIGADNGADDRSRDAEAGTLAELRERMRLARRGERADREGQGGESDGRELGELVHGRDPCVWALARCAGDHVMSSPDDERKPRRQARRCSRRNRDVPVREISLIAC